MKRGTDSDVSLTMVRTSTLTFIMITTAVSKTAALLAHPRSTGLPRAHHLRLSMSSVNEREQLVRPRPVRLGMADLLWPFATHWAVQVQDKWYEVQGASKGETGTPMAITTFRHPTRSSIGAHVSRFGRVGETAKSEAEIEAWIEAWTLRNPVYFWGTDNCQKFAREFIGWLTDETHSPLPMMDAGTGGNRAAGPRAWAGAERGSAYAGATVATMQGHRGLLNGALDAPNAAAAALCNREGFGAFGEAELGRIVGGFGPIRVAVHININTCLGWRNRGLELLVGGFGVKLGANGVSVSLPVLTVGIGRRVC